MRGENVGFLLLVVAFTLPPLIRPGFAGPPSPEGEGFGAVELGDCLRKRTGSAGACPRPTKGTFSLFKLLSYIELGDPPKGMSPPPEYQTRIDSGGTPLLPLPLGEVARRKP